jgi:AcrR family transcriptional regulator
MNGAAGNRRERILAAAIEAFARGGFRGATTRAIAEAAGVTDALLFYHFGSKGDLYLAAVKDQLAKLREGLDRACAEREGADPADLLAGFVEVYLCYFLDLEPGLSVTLRELNGVPAPVAAEISRTHYRAVRKLLQEILQAGVDAGSFRPIDVRACALAITGILQIFIRAEASGRSPFTRADAIAQVLEYYRTGLLVSAPPPAARGEGSLAGTPS